MAKINVLVEVVREQAEAFAIHASAIESDVETFRESEQLLANLAGFGLEVTGDIAPVPMFGPTGDALETLELSAFNTRSVNPDLPSSSMVVSCQVDRAKLEELESQSHIRVWPNSPLTMYEGRDFSQVAATAAEPAHLFDLASSAAGVDCQPFLSGVSIQTVRDLLGVEAVWSDGFRGQNLVVGILDSGVNGSVYPVVGGFSLMDASRTPGSAPITSHGSMCAADVLVAAPAAKIYDYPFIGVPNSGGALTMFQAVLNQRRIDGTPHLTNNSFGFVARPSRDLFPNHEVWNVDHPLHRKVREVVASGAPAFFPAGNCGAECRSPQCHPSGVGPGNSIHGSNSLQEVITVAAVNSRNERIGYSSQGPGGFFERKPDIASYAHFFGNFGPGRPGGTTDQPFDNGTSAASPLAAGVAALLLSAFPGCMPDQLKEALICGAFNIGPPGWDADTGYGVINAAASYTILARDLVDRDFWHV